MRSLQGLGLAALIATLVSSPAWSATPPATNDFAREIDAAKAAMMVEPQTALVHARNAVKIAKAAGGPEREQALAAADWLTAEALIRTKHAAEAVPVLNEAIPLAARSGGHTKLDGDLLKARGKANAALGKPQLALQDFQTAYRIFQAAHEPRSQAMALQEMGSIYADARDYPHVLQYYAQSLEAFGQDPALSLTADNNRGFALKDMGRLSEAQAAFRRALASATRMGSAYLEASILTNIAFVEAQQRKFAAARVDAGRGLALAGADPEAREERPFLFGVLAKIEAEQGHAVAAQRLLDQTFAGVDLATSPPEFRDFHELAAQVYEKGGDRAKALEHMKAFKRLDDEGRDIAASTSAQLVAAKFDFATQATKIAELKANEAQAKARSSAIITLILLIGGLAVTSLITHAFFSMRRSRNQIRAANTALEKALRAKTEFLAATSHEIRTPLNGILGMTQVLLADRALAAEVRDRLTVVKSAGDTMQALVNDLLDVAKIETGVLTLKTTTFDLSALVRDVAQGWSETAKGKGLDFHLELDDCPAEVVSDPDRLRQVVFNLLSNAVKFTETGFVRLAVSAAAAEGADGERLLIVVEDSGIGIREEDRARIFESFTQVDGGATRQYPGAGLGLAICRNVAKALGGAIGVESTPGRGSTFTFSAPLERAALAEAVGAEGGLIVVDDNPLAQAMLRAFLTDRFPALTFVGSVEEAIAAARAGRPRRILVDGAAMQRGSPEDPFAPIRVLTSQVDTPVTVLWPAPTDADKEAMASFGIDQVLAKPIAPLALIAALQAADRAADRAADKATVWAADGSATDAVPGSDLAVSA